MGRPTRVMYSFSHSIPIIVAKRCQSVAMPFVTIRVRVPRIAVVTSRGNEAAPALYQSGARANLAGFARLSGALYDTAAHR